MLYYVIVLIIVFSGGAVRGSTSDLTRQDAEDFLTAMQERVGRAEVSASAAEESAMGAQKHRDWADGAHTAVIGSLDLLGQQIRAGLKFSPDAEGILERALATNTPLSEAQIAAAVQSAVAATLAAQPAPAPAPPAPPPLDLTALGQAIGNALPNPAVTSANIEAAVTSAVTAALGARPPQSALSDRDLAVLGASIGAAIPRTAAAQGLTQQQVQDAVTAGANAAIAIRPDPAQLAVQVGGQVATGLKPTMDALTAVVKQLGQTAWYVPTGGSGDPRKDAADQAAREAAMRAKVQAQLQAKLGFAQDMAARVKQGQIAAELATIDLQVKADFDRRKKLLEIRRLPENSATEAAIAQAEEEYEAKMHERKLELQKNSLELQDKMHGRKWENLQKMFSAMGTGMKDPKRMALLAATMGGGAAGIYGARLAMRQLEIYLNKPKLVRDTSNRGLFRSKKDNGVRFSDMVLSPQLSAKLHRVMESAVHAYQHGTNLPNVGLYGPPGTGKTMFIEALANESGMMYAKMTGGDVSALLSSGGQNIAVTEIHKLFDWLEAHGPAVLLVDEADAFLRNGRDGKLSEGLAAAINAFLSRTGSSSSKIMVVFATNYPESLDGAVRSRVSVWIFVDRPSSTERYELIKYEIAKLVKNGLGMRHIPVLVDDSLNHAELAKLAKRTEGFAGRDIKMKLIDPLEREMARKDQFTITSDLVNNVLDTTLEQERELMKWDSGTKPTFNGIGQALAAQG